jgi:arginine-tRNA-protein transferase
MMLKGWRRCGTYFYKPNLPESCCKLFTIRLRAEAYQMNGSQKKRLKKFNRFLAPSPATQDASRRNKREERVAKRAELDV